LSDLGVWRLCSAQVKIHAFFSSSNLSSVKSAIAMSDV
jgi:hypothetical protein